MLYVIQKGNQYIRLSDTGKVDTVGLKKATKFTLDEARRTKLKAPVKTKGFENVVIFVNGDSVSIIVRDDQLNTEKVAQIQNIISREMNTKVENIHISNK